MLLCLFILGQELLEAIYLLLQLYYCLKTEYLTKIKRPIITLFLFYLRIYQVNFTLWLINESEGWIKCRKRNELMCDNNEGGRSRCHPPFTVLVQSLTSKLQACYFLILQKRSRNVQPADVHLDFCHLHNLWRWHVCNFIYSPKHQAEKPKLSSVTNWLTRLPDRHY